MFDYSAINKFLDSFNIFSFNNPHKVREYLDFFNLDSLLKNLDEDDIPSTGNIVSLSVDPNEAKPFVPQFNDLTRLHFITLKKKSVNVLEFGSGFSTIFILHALNILSSLHHEYAVENFRADKYFHLYTVEEDSRFMDITQRRVPKELVSNLSISLSGIKLSQHDSRFCTYYNSLPNISPDFIYIDGPSLFATSDEINGFAINNWTRMPMSADILRFEFFLEPGTIIVIDGRTQNARFLKTYLKRNWAYFHDVEGDAHYFELQEQPLGKISQMKLNFSCNGAWLLA